jgi:ankyrin repeat protein
MYPNPQDALPLPSRPNLAQYKKLAKDLVKACKSGDPAPVRAWAARWVERLVALDGRAVQSRQQWIDGQISQVAQFALDRLSRGEASPGRCALADAQFVIARAHGFLSWPKFASHLGSLARTSSPVSAYEAAADAIVAGDAFTVQRLLRDNSDLVRARSMREHNATLLHYVSANGIEGYRQKSPKNAADIARLLLEAGAEVDAEADVYGGGCTTLGLVATSSPPKDAGVQLQVLDVLLEYGARMDHPGSAGNKSALIRGCLANGCPEAAEHLIERGASIDFVGAAGTGRLDALGKFFTDNGVPKEAVTPAQINEGLAMAAGYGSLEAVDFLLDSGIEVDRELQLYGQGHTALHISSYHAYGDIVRSLLRRGARVDIRDRTWGTPPLTWALTGWSHGKAPDARYHETVAMLVAAGSEVKSEWLEWEKVRADPRMRAALNPAS